MIFHDPSPTILRIQHFMTNHPFPFRIWLSMTHHTTHLVLTTTQPLVTHPKYSVRIRQLENQLPMYLKFSLMFGLEMSYQFFIEYKTLSIRCWKGRRERQFRRDKVEGRHTWTERPIMVRVTHATRIDSTHTLSMPGVSGPASG